MEYSFHTKFYMNMLLRLYQFINEDLYLTANYREVFHQEDEHVHLVVYIYLTKASMSNPLCYM